MKAHPNKDMTLKPHPKNVSFREGPDEGPTRNLHSFVQFGSASISQFVIPTTTRRGSEEESAVRHHSREVITRS
jgi:hypothetical protein